MDLKFGFHIFDPKTLVDMSKHKRHFDWMVGHYFDMDLARMDLKTNF